MNGLDKLIKRYESRLELATELRDSSLKKVMENADKLKHWVAGADLVDMMYDVEFRIQDLKQSTKEYDKRTDEFYSLRKTLKELKELAEEGEQK